MTLALGNQHAGSPSGLATIPAPAALRLGLPAPSAAAAPTEAPSWLRFPPCFSNYVEWAKNSSSGALFGSYHQILTPALSAAASLGDVPLSFRRWSPRIPHCWGLLDGTPPCSGPEQPGQVARGSVQAVWPPCPAWPGCAGAGALSIPRPWLPSGQAGGFDFMIYGSACPTSPRSSFNRCSQGQETRRRGCGQRGGGGNRGITVGSDGQTDNWPTSQSPSHPSVCPVGLAEAQAEK